MDLYIHFPIRLHGVVLRENFTIPDLPCRRPEVPANTPLRDFRLNPLLGTYPFSQNVDLARPVDVYPARYRECAVVSS
jgi:hypothetical protein